MKKNLLRLIFGKIIFAFFLTYAHAMEDEGAFSSGTPLRSGTPLHIYDALEPYYKSKNNFLHIFLKKIHKELTDETSSNYTGIVEQPRVFFSHAYEDGGIYTGKNQFLIKLLETYLKDLKIMFRNDITGYKLGDILSDRMKEDVNWADILLVIYTKTYEKKMSDPSTGVYAEWTQAKEKNKKIIYMVIEQGVTPPKGPLYLPFTFTDAAQFHTNMFYLMRSLFKGDPIPLCTHEEDFQGSYKSALKSGDFKKARELFECEEEEAELNNADFILSLRVTARKQVESLEKLVRIVKRNSTGAFKVLNEFAEEGYREAQTALGKLYEEGGILTPQDDVKALNWYVKARSAENLSRMTKKGSTMALKALEELMEDGDLEAQVILGALYEEGTTLTPRNEAKAIELYAEATEKNNQNGLENLIRMVKREREEALKVLEELAEEGCSSAQTALGQLYEAGGVLTPQDDTKAAEWYEEDATIKENDKGREGLIRMVKKGSLKALRSVERLAEKYNSNGRFALATLYEEGSSLVPQDEYKAFFNITRLIREDLVLESFTRMAKGGNRKVLRLIENIEELGIDEPNFFKKIQGRLYEEGGLLTAQDDTKALDFYSRAQSVKNLVRMMKKGTVDSLKVIETLKTLAEEGHKKAQLAMGRLCEDGEYTPQDEAGAVNWYAKAEGVDDLVRMVARKSNLALKALKDLSEKENKEAQAALGELYEKGGDLTPQDASKAIFLYVKASDDASLNRLVRMVKRGNTEALKALEDLAEKYNLMAQIDLGRLYELGGSITPQDDKKAVDSYVKALKFLDHPIALKSLVRMAKKGNTDAFKALEMLSERWSTVSTSLGKLYERGGRLTPQDDEKATAWYIKSGFAKDLIRMMRKGNTKALQALEELDTRGSPFALGEFYEEKAGQTSDDEIKAVEWYKKANSDFSLGRMAKRGSISALKALEMRLYEKFKSTHEMFKISEVLGGLYEEGGTMIPQDETKAIALYARGEVFHSLKRMVKLGSTNALKALETLAENGNGDAQVLLGEIYEDGSSLTAQDEAKAIDFYAKVIQACGTKGIEDFGFFNLMRMVKKGSTKALKALETFAENGNIGAQFAFGVLYELGGSLTPQDDMKALELCEKVEFVCPLKKMVKKKNMRALKVLETIAEKKTHEGAGAQKMLGELYEKGTPLTPKDEERAVDWYVKGKQVDDLKRMIKMGSTRALKAFEALAENGTRDYQKALGELYEQGGSPTPLKDEEKAVGWYFKGRQVDDLKRMIIKGVVVALKAFETLAEKGTQDDQRTLGEFYEYGGSPITPKDEEKAVGWYAKGKQISKLKKMIVKGSVVALKSLETLAEDGTLDAQTALGELYEQGGSPITPKDEKKAVDWYVKGNQIYKLKGMIVRGSVAAFNALKMLVEKGMGYAPTAFGELYEEGSGLTPKDEDKAFDLFVKGKQFDHLKRLIINGSTAALKALKMLAEKESYNDQVQIPGLKSRAKKENPYAERVLGELYEEGSKLTPKDEDKAFDLYVKGEEVLYLKGMIERGSTVALKALETLGEKGNHDAQKWLGELYESGSYLTPKDEEKAIDWYVKGNQVEKLKGMVVKGSAAALKALETFAEKGDKSTQIQLGELYEKGSNLTPKDDEKAVDWFIRSENGYHLKRMVLRDSTRALKVLETLAENGNRDAQKELGELYEEGSTLTPKDDEKAVDWYAKEKQVYYLTSNLKRMILKGSVVALKAFEMLAENGNKYDQKELGELYEHGGSPITPKDDEKAAGWYVKGRQINDLKRMIVKGSVVALNALETLAEKGNHNAQSTLGEFYEHGGSPITPKDEEKAIDWYVKGKQIFYLERMVMGGPRELSARSVGRSAAGSPRALKALETLAKKGTRGARNALGELYEYGGPITPKNEVKAVEWHIKGLSFNNYSLINMVRRGSVVALEAMRILAEKGIKKAQEVLGELYEKGSTLTPKDEETAVDWYVKGESVVCLIKMVKGGSTKALKAIETLAENGNNQEQKVLGELYEQGSSVAPKDEEKAVDWFTRAKSVRHLKRMVMKESTRALQALEMLAENGSDKAQSVLGRLYEQGSSLTPKDEGKAIDWFAKAKSEKSLKRMVMKESTRALQALEMLAENGSDKAQSVLGQLYECGGPITPKDEIKAIAWYVKRVRALSNDHLVRMTKKGSLGALEALKTLAEKKVRSAQEVLGKLYEQGGTPIIPKDEEKAVDWFIGAKSGNGLKRMVMKESTRAFQALETLSENGNDKAQSALGQLYENGGNSLTPKNEEKAVDLFTRAKRGGHLKRMVMRESTRALQALEMLAEKGIKNVQIVLGDLYEHGESPITPEDEEKAVGWYLKAENGNGLKRMVMMESTNALKALEMLAEKGNKNASKMLVGLSRYAYFGMPKDEATVVDWYTRAESVFSLREMIKKGSQMALNALEMLGKKENKIAQQQLGQLYENGESAITPKNEEKAVDWYTKAENVSSLSRMIETGSARALTALEMLAEKGIRNAQVDLGRLYKKGSPLTPKNKEKAIEWFKKAECKPGETFDLSESEDENFFVFDMGAFDRVDSERVQSERVQSERVDSPNAAFYRMGAFEGLDSEDENFF
ncbi:MAG: hypothetical protein B7Y25_02670 [Alphaproteobacteria bacterium 16-39-46]|nr:MAG: hypothetical protein B7Y25_02670 [Alphaproteobacteria bacterium 16-39-46]OZA43544.1 MAG: hypothetical protein B7X84_02840 [Alphaproteobacteria bacterium 17-39-52]HQS83800.1 hypothetical protein [Alphaproteobacteria bacterium]HQS93583.1 hypothetical protein [Alphaproteobacteria bacterium]